MPGSACSATTGPADDSPPIDSTAVGPAEVRVNSSEARPPEPTGTPASDPTAGEAATFTESLGVLE